MWRVYIFQMSEWILKDGNVRTMNFTTYTTFYSHMAQSIAFISKEYSKKKNVLYLCLWSWFKEVSFIHSLLTEDRREQQCISIGLITIISSVTNAANSRSWNIWTNSWNATYWIICGNQSTGNMEKYVKILPGRIKDFALSKSNFDPLSHTTSRVYIISPLIFIISRILPSSYIMTH